MNVLTIKHIKCITFLINLCDPFIKTKSENQVTAQFKFVFWLKTAKSRDDLNNSNMHWLLYEVKIKHCTAVIQVQNVIITCIHLMSIMYVGNKRQHSMI